MSSNPSQPPANEGRVLPFRRRGGARGGGWRWPVRNPGRSAAPVEGLARYEHAPDAEDDYRHRMKMNVLAFIVTAVLIVIGVWLANTIAQLRKDQDCYLSGRRNCNPITVPLTDRG